MKACLTSWLVNRPGAHPLWAWWIVAVVHLREIPGAPPALLQYPEAQFEFQIITLNPEVPVELELHETDASKHWSFMAPSDVITQFHGCDDAAAIAIVDEDAIRCIVDEGVSPDEDLRSWWNEAIRNDVEHRVFGGHPQGTA